MDFSALFPFAPEVGYLGLSLVNFFGSLIPFIPLPGFLLLASMSVGDQFNIHLLVLVSALTATVAKQIIFYVSYEGRHILNEKTRKRMRPFERLVKRYGAAAAFIAAATPIPDDLIYVPLGLAKYNPKRFFIAIGKQIIKIGERFSGNFKKKSRRQQAKDNLTSGKIDTKLYTDEQDQGKKIGLGEKIIKAIFSIFLGIGRLFTSLFQPGKRAARARK